MLVAGKFAWVPHVKLPVKYLWYSGKFTCARRQCACVLREVLAASKQVNLPVITGKLHVTQVKRARDLFTCELHVKLPAFAGNFARTSFTVKFPKLGFWCNDQIIQKLSNHHFGVFVHWVRCWTWRDNWLNWCQPEVPLVLSHANLGFL